MAVEPTAPVAACAERAILEVVLVTVEVARLLLVVAFEIGSLPTLLAVLVPGGFAGEL